MDTSTYGSDLALEEARYLSIGCSCPVRGVVQAIQKDLDK